MNKCLLIRKGNKSIEEITWPPHNYEVVNTLLPGAMNRDVTIQDIVVNKNPLEWVGVIDGAGFKGHVSILSPTSGTLSLNDPNVFMVGDTLVKDWAFVAVREKNSGTLQLDKSLVAKTGLALTQESELLEKYVSFEPKELLEPEVVGDLDRQMQDQYVRFICDVASKHEDSVLRFIARDRRGNQTAQRNYRHIHRPELDRWILDSFDRHETVYFDWNVRSKLAIGDNVESDPIKVLASPAKTDSPDFILGALDGEHNFVIHDDKKFTAKEPTWYPIAGMPQRTPKDDTFVTFKKVK